jgi:hypothetical protein
MLPEAPDEFSCPSTTATSPNGPPVMACGVMSRRTTSWGSICG